MDGVDPTNSNPLQGGSKRKKQTCPILAPFLSAQQRAPEINLNQRAELCFALRLAVVSLLREELGDSRG